MMKEEIICSIQLYDLFIYKLLNTDKFINKLLYINKLLINFAQRWKGPC